MTNTNCMLILKHSLYIRNKETTLRPLHRTQGFQYKLIAIIKQNWSYAKF